MSQSNGKELVDIYLNLQDDTPPEQNQNQGQVMENQEKEMTICETNEEGNMRV